MISSNYRFTLDLHSTQSQISLPVTLGDTARVFYISLSDGGAPYIIEDGVLAKMEIKRPTGTFIEAFCAIEKNTIIKYDFAQNTRTAIVEGIHDCAVILYDAEGNVIGSPRFTMVVSNRVVNSDDINLSDEDITAIDTIMAAEASRQAAELGRINKEAERQIAEEGRIATMNTIRQMLENGEFDPTVTNVTLLASAWEGDESPYSQVVTIAGVTEFSKVDLQPSVEQLAIFHNKDLAFVTENEDGVVTVYAIGQKPANDYTMQVTITEVTI